MASASLRLQQKGVFEGCSCISVPAPTPKTFSFQRRVPTRMPNVWWSREMDVNLDEFEPELDDNVTEFARASPSICSLLTGVGRVATLPALPAILSILFLSVRPASRSFFWCSSMPSEAIPSVTKAPNVTATTQEIWMMFGVVTYALGINCCISTSKTSGALPFSEEYLSLKVRLKRMNIAETYVSGTTRRQVRSIWSARWRMRALWRSVITLSECEYSCIVRSRSTVLMSFIVSTQSSMNSLRLRMPSVSLRGCLSQ
mmetsp:Transcript_4098/g.8856  ORF Transcript_4098/g.8856 Transcript_4098/m.8856 type:complete len:258 (-) Transcript_4098:780-1553(-)